ncbi:hypothetical protein VB264_23280 [Arcicella aquatica]|uniref:NERD domain-containing protein n=1 Tax=Arcicella aquatica TaxID=217141 RepID=A0ABU5QUG8_9BACT|nr:hypothetical protein [Arcicella aquatica]MEA5260741.1 hypothetical protein [Arcicella aquatica]
METINWKKIQKLDLVKQLTNENIPRLTNTTYKGYFSDFEYAMNKLDFLTSRNLLIVLLWNNSQKTLADIQKKGIFRATKQLENNKTILGSIIDDLLQTTEIISKLDNIEKEYLESIYNLFAIFPSLKKCQDNVIKEIKSFKNKYPNGSFIKTLMAWNDYLFVSSYIPDYTNDLIQSQTKEELSEAISYLIYKYTTIFQDDPIQFLIEMNYLESEEFENLVVSICTFIDIREKEINIDYFGYRCIFEKGRLIIKPPFEDFEKSLRLGYIRTDIQYLNDMMYNARIQEDSGGLLFQHFIEELINKSSIKFIHLNHTLNSTRYSFVIPEIVHEKILVDFLGTDRLFIDEVNYLRYLYKEQQLDFESLNQIKIKENLTLYEFIRIKRFFNFMFFAFSYEVFKIEKDPYTIIRSLVPVLTITQLYKIINPLFEKDKIDSFLELISWSRDSNSMLDLQYYPIYKSKELIHISLSVLANSSYIRNLYASEYSKGNNAIMSDGKKDLLTEKLEKFLKNAGINVHTEINVSTTDIDVLACFDSTLFIFECKNGLHPVNSFDLRGTYNHIKKAELQLGKIQELYKNGKLAQILKYNCDIELDDIQNISYSIVLGNRLFNGNIFDYPVRYISELVNIIETGNIHTEEGTFCIWEENRITAKVLLNYMSNENEIFKIYTELLNETRLSKKFFDSVIEMDTYEISTDKNAMSNIIKKYTNTFRKVEE